MSFEFPFVEIDGVPLEILEYPDSDYQAVVRRGSLFTAYAKGEEHIAEASATAPPPSPGSGASAATHHRRQP